MFVEMSKAKGVLRIKFIRRFNRAGALGYRLSLSDSNRLIFAAA